MPHPGEALDHGGDAFQGPQPPSEPVGAGALQQGLFDLAELSVRELGCWSGWATAAQALGAVGLPAPVPEMNTLAGDTESAGNLGLADTGGEQLGGAQPTILKPLALLVAAGGGRWLAYGRS